MQKKLVDKLPEEYSEDIDGNKMIYNIPFNNYGEICNSCTLYILFFVIVFLMIIGISSAYFYFNW